MRARQLGQPRELGPRPGDGQGRTGVGAADPWQRRDRVLDAFLVFEPPDEQQAGADRYAATRGGKARRHVDSVADHVESRQVRAVQSADLVAHRRRTGDQRVGLVGRATTRPVHLPVDLARDPPAVPAGFGGVKRRHQRHVVDSASAIAGCATSQSWACTTSGVQPSPRPGLPSAIPARTIAWPIASVHASMSSPNRNTGGSSATATTSTPSAKWLCVGCVDASVPEGRRRQHDDLVPRGGEFRREVMHVATEPADHDRRVLPRDDQNLHVHADHRPASRRASSRGNR